LPQLLGAPLAHEEGNVAPRSLQTRPEISADRAGADDQNPHSLSILWRAELRTLA
jgi:hypothetical protein